MNLNFSNLTYLGNLAREEYLYIGIFISLGSVVSSFLISLYTLKDKAFLSFIKNTFLSLQFLYSFLFCIFSFLFCTWLYGYESYMWFMTIVLLGLFVLSYIDCVCLAIPDWLNFTLLFFIFGSLYYFSVLSFDHFISAFGVCGAFALLRIFGEFIFKKEIMGEADIVVLASMGALLSIIPSIYLALVASFLAILYIVLLSVIHIKGKQIALSQIKLPFVCFLSLAFVIILFYLQYPLWGELSV